MRMVKCDRCGEINEDGDKIIVFENSTTNSDKIIETDLCKKCQGLMLYFFKPIPMKEKPAIAD